MLIDVTLKKNPRKNLTNIYIASKIHENDIILKKINLVRDKTNSKLKVAKSEGNFQNKYKKTTPTRVSQEQK